MTKLEKWAKKYPYKWENEQFRKASSVVIWWLIGMALIFGCVITVGFYFGMSSEIKGVVCIIWSFVAGTLIGAGYTLQYADEEFKKKVK